MSKCKIFQTWLKKSSRQSFSLFLQANFKIALKVFVVNFLTKSENLLTESGK